MVAPGPYNVLEVPRTADEDDIRAAYRRLAIARHPDKNAADPNATEAFQKVS